MHHVFWTLVEGNQSAEEQRERVSTRRAAETTQQIKEQLAKQQVRHRGMLHSWAIFGTEQLLYTGPYTDFHWGGFHLGKSLQNELECTAITLKHARIWLSINKLMFINITLISYNYTKNKTQLLTIVEDKGYFI